jgi:hypothetical protein
MSAYYHAQRCVETGKTSQELREEDHRVRCQFERDYPIERFLTIDEGEDDAHSGGYDSVDE